MLTWIYRSAAAWTAIGLAAGLYYREFSKQYGMPKGTQLSVVHTHALALGTLGLLIVLGLTAVFALRGPALKWGVILWNVGLLITTGSMLFKGSLQTMGRTWVNDAPALAGIAGLGHMTITAALVCVLVALGKGVKAKQLELTDQA